MGVLKLKINGFLAALSTIFVLVGSVQAAPVIVDHRHTDITQIPQSAIEQAKANLHIVYGHTSHGSQLTHGMSGLVTFANNGGLGLSLPTDIFAYNNGGSNGALDLHDGGMGGDVGYYPQWVNNTRNYLSNNPDVNVVIWSWCGQVDYKYSHGTLHSEYIEPMTQLETDYPDVMFVYMTGHVDIYDDADNKAANQVIRDYCNANDKILYDFADIERYDPDGNYYEFVHDNCNYYAQAGGSSQGNWATEWQNSHTEGVDWYSCYSAHSQALNANRKAYGAWWLWARLGGWEGNVEPVCNNNGVCDDGEDHNSCPSDCQDLTPPVRSDGSPSDTLAYGTTNVDISLNTDEHAVCRYSTTPDTSYDAMSNTLATSNDTFHTAGITGLQNGSTYIYYLRCRDDAGNRNDDDYEISFTVSDDPTVETSVRVSATNDDAEENSDGGMSLSSSDLELVTDGSTQTIGIRFSAVDVPQGATITHASIVFTADEAHSEATSLVIEAEAGDNPATFTSATNNISSRTRTSSSVSWDNLPTWTIGQTYQSPDISSVVQELTDRAGWRQNNSMVFIITGSGRRTAESYDGVSSAAPLLQITFSTAPLIQAGDVNGDGEVTTVDIVLALQVAVGLNPSGVVPESDANSDGRIGIAEAITALRKVAGI